MKSLVLIALMVFAASCQDAEQKAVSNSPANAVHAENAALPEGLEELEDCDEKAEKAAEKEVIEVNLGGDNDAGCSIE